MNYTTIKYQLVAIQFLINHPLIFNHKLINVNQLQFNCEIKAL